MSKKKVAKNGKIFLILKSNGLDKITPTSQTAKMRNTINEKIRELGFKYYQVKNLFDKLKLKRDYIFEIGQQLVEEYKNVKKGIYLQSQQRRMKEALIVWFTENFYFEIFAPNSTFLDRFLVKTNEPAIKKAKNISKCKERKNHSNNQKNSFTIPNKEQQNKSLFTDISYNKEIDNFDYSNVNNDLKNDKTSDHTSNFDFDVYL